MKITSGPFLVLSTALFPTVMARLRSPIASRELLTSDVTSSSSCKAAAQETWAPHQGATISVTDSSIDDWDPIVSANGIKIDGIPMYNAGNEQKDLVSEAYLNYNCQSDTLDVLVPVVKDV